MTQQTESSGTWFRLNRERSDEPDDGWRWDPEHPPAEFTPSMIRRMSLADVTALNSPDNGILDETQQRSFDKAYEEWWSPQREQLRRWAKGLLPQFEMKSHLSPGLSSSVTHLTERLAAQLEASSRFDRSLDEPLPGRAPVPHSRRILDTTNAGALEAEVEHTTDQLDLLSSIAGVLIRQEAASTRGAFFYVIVSTMVIVAGVSPLVTMTREERLWTIGVSGVVAGLAGIVYWVVRCIQTREK